MCLALHICTSGTMGDLCCSPPHICNLQVWAETHLQILEKFSESPTFAVVDLSPQVNDSCLYCQIFFSAHSEVGFFIIKLGKIQAHQSKNVTGNYVDFDRAISVFLLYCYHCTTAKIEWLKWFGNHKGFVDTSRIKEKKRRKSVAMAKPRKFGHLIY